MVKGNQVEEKNPVGVPFLKDLKCEFNRLE